VSEPFAFNPMDPAFVADPFPVYARGRAESPVHRHAGLPMLSLFRHADIVPVLSDADLWSSRFPLPPKAAELGLDPDREQSMLGQDPPEHDRLRSFVNRGFTPRRIRELEPHLRKIAGELLDDALARGRVDFVEAYSYPLPVIVIAELIGVPTADRHQFKEWSDKIVENLGEGMGGTPIDPVRAKERAEVSREMDAYFSRLLDERMREPRDDLLTQLVSAERDGDRLTRGEMLTMLSVLLIAGNETTRNLIGNIVIQLLAHPGELARLRADPGLVPMAVNEVLRFDSSVQSTVRRATRPTEIGSEKIAQGDAVLTWLGSANRDESVFENADRFDITRDPNHHLSFGFGVHYCMGSHLARLEARVALDELLKRTRSFERTDDAPIERTPSFILRGPERLQVELIPA
jgi:cytochrome P450